MLFILFAIIGGIVGNIAGHVYIGTFIGMLFGIICYAPTAIGDVFEGVVDVISALD